MEGENPSADVDQARLVPQTGESEGLEQVDLDSEQTGMVAKY
jgi:hypothetical protein